MIKPEWLAIVITLVLAGFGGLRWLISSVMKHEEWIGEIRTDMKDMKDRGVKRDEDVARVREMLAGIAAKIDFLAEALRHDRASNERNRDERTG